MKLITSSIFFAICLTSVLSGGPSCGEGKHKLKRGECLIELDRLYSCYRNWAINIYLGEFQILDLTNPPQVWTEVIKNDAHNCRDTSLCVTSGGVLELRQCSATLIGSWGTNVDYIEIDETGLTSFVSPSGVTVLTIEPYADKWYPV